MTIGSYAAWRAWGARGWLVWGTFGLVIVGVVVWSLAAHTQTTVRRIGLAYEVIGVLVVLVDLSRAMRKHGVDWPHVRVWRYLREPFVRRTVTLSASADIGRGSSSTASLTGSGSVGATLEERVKVLEQRLVAVDSRIDTVESRIADEERARAKALADEAALRDGGDASLREAIKQIEVGSVDLSFFGLFWLLVGMVMTTGTQEVCDWVAKCMQ